MFGSLGTLAVLLASSNPSDSAVSRIGVSNQNEYLPTPVSLNVCLSPGCVADGAPIALDKLRALAPPYMDVQGGPCRSFCGSGPVVVEDTIAKENSKKIKTKPYKKVNSEDRILQLLYPNGGVPMDLVEGYRLGVDGNKAFEKGDYALAVTLYEKAVALAFRPAVDLQRQRDEYDENDSKPKEKSNLEWLIRVRRNEAVAKLGLKDYDGALLAIQASCEISQNTSGESAIVLGRVCEKKGDVAGELAALENLFAIPVDEGKLGRQEQNDRRLAQIRLMKLQFMKARS